MLRKSVMTVAALAVLGGVAACEDPVTTAPSAGAGATGDPTRTIAPSVLGGGEADLGIKWNWNLKPPLAYAKEIGWGETFYEVEWCALRERPAAQRFAPVERILGMAQDMGYRLMLKIRVGNCAGGEKQLDPAEGTRKSPSTFPDDPGAYQQFVTTLVTRYKERGVQIWAIENEVDANNFWSGTPDEYVRLVDLAAKAIRAADPQATVLDAGIASTGYGIALSNELMAAGKEQEALDLYTRWFARRHGAAAARFPQVASIEELRRLLGDARAERVVAMVEANWRAVNAGQVTAYQLHFYEDPQLLPQLLAYVRGHLQVPIPIQGWEIGTAWPGPGYSEAIHGGELVQLIGILLREKVSPIVYLPLAYTPGGATKVEIFRGLVSPEGADLPSGQVYQRYAAAVRSSRAIHGVRFEGGSGVLIVGSGSSLAAIWPERPGGELKLTAAGARPGSAPQSVLPAGATTTEPVLVDLTATDPSAARSALARTLGVAVSTD